MNMLIRASFFLLLALSTVESTVITAQEKLTPVSGTAGKCEEAKALLDLLLNDAGDEGVIILVARHGDGESRKVNRQRLYAVWSYLHHAGQFPESRLVQAQGERVRGHGRGELYAKGKLMLVLAATRNADIVGVKSCGRV